MNLMKREYFGDLREAVHTANPSMILANVTAACLYGQGVEVMRYINDASRVAPYNSISTWGDDPAVAEMCDYINKVNMSREPEDLGNLAYLIMSSEWCDEWLAFAIDVLGHIDVGTVNLGDALHWWCGHWRVLHQRILDAGWKCEPRHVWFILSAMMELRHEGMSTYGALWAEQGLSMFYSYPAGFEQWSRYETNHPLDFHDNKHWWFTVRPKPDQAVGLVESAHGPHNQIAVNARKARGRE